MYIFASISYAYARMTYVVSSMYTCIYIYIYIYSCIQLCIAV